MFHPNQPTRHRVRRLAAGATALLLAVAGSLLVASPAHAIPSGAGWAASWEYYTSTAFELSVELPGGEVTTYTSDSGGNRMLVGTVVDTNARDRYCVRARVIVTDGGLVTSETVCQGGDESFQTPTFTGAVFVYLDLMIGNTIDHSNFTFVPSSASDAGLRTIGTGVSWQYVSGTQYHLELVRPGVSVVADGVHQNATERSALFSVSDTGGAGSCSDAWAYDATIAEWAGVCAPNPPAGNGSFDYQGWIKFRGCHFPAAAPIMCLTGHLPEPN